MNPTLSELKVACPQCGQHCIVPCGEIGLQISCPECALPFVPAEATRIRGDGTLTRPLGKPETAVSSAPSAREQEEDWITLRRRRESQTPEALQLRARECVWVALFFLLLAAVWLIFYVTAETTEGELRCAQFMEGCIALSFMLGVIGQLLHIRAALEKPKS